MERKIVFVCFDPWAIRLNKHKLMTEKIGDFQSIEVIETNDNYVYKFQKDNQTIYRS